MEFTRKMVSIWQAGVNYGLNDVVNHNGKTYKIRQPHTSQADWEPQMTPALWSVVPDQYQDQNQQHQQQAQVSPHYQQHQPPPSYQNHQENQQYQKPPQSHDQDQHQNHEDDKNFFEKIGDKLGTGGTIAAGVGLAAVVGGGIALAVNHSKKDKDDDKL
jgi:hypothetical protein